MSIPMNCCISQEVSSLEDEVEAPGCFKMLRALYFLGCYDQNGFDLVWGIRHSVGARQDENMQLNRVSIVGKFLRKQGCFTLGSLVDMYITTRTPSKQIPGILKIRGLPVSFFITKRYWPCHFDWRRQVLIWLPAHPVKISHTLAVWMCPCGRSGGGLPSRLKWEMWISMVFWCYPSMYFIFTYSTVNAGIVN